MRQLLVPGATSTFAREILGTLRVPVSGLGLVVGAIIFWVLTGLRQTSSTVLTGALLLAIAPVFWALFFTVLHSAARGSHEVDWKEVGDAFARILRPTIRACVLTVVWVIAGMALRRLRPSFIAAHLDPMAWFCLICTCAAAPSVFIALANDEEIASALSPIQLFARVRALGFDYALASGAMAIVGCLCFWWVGSARLDQGIAVLPLLLDASSLYSLFVVARVVGLLLSVRGNAVGYGLPADALVPALANAVPRGHRRERRVEPPKERPTFIELE